MIYYRNMKTNMETRSEPVCWWKLAPVYTDDRLNKYQVNKQELRHHSGNRDALTPCQFSIKISRNYGSCIIEEIGNYAPQIKGKRFIHSAIQRTKNPYMTQVYECNEFSSAILIIYLFIYFSKTEL